MGNWIKRHQHTYSPNTLKMLGLYSADAICSAVKRGAEPKRGMKWGIKSAQLIYALLCIIRSKIISASICSMYSLGEGGLKSHSSCTRIQKLTRAHPKCLHSVFLVSAASHPLICWYLRDTIRSHKIVYDDDDSRLLHSQILILILSFYHS